MTAIESTALRTEPDMGLAHAAGTVILAPRVGAPERALLFPEPAVSTSPRDSARRRALAGADVLAVLVAYAGVWLLAPPPESLLSRWPLLAALPLWILLNKLLGLYDRDDKVIHKSTLDELPKLLQSVTMGALAIFMLAPTVTGIEVYREQNLLFVVLAVFTMPLLRAGARGVIRRAFAPEKCLIVGSDDVAATLSRKIGAHAEYGIEVVGRADGRDLDGFSEQAVPRLGHVDDVETICARHGIERVIVGFSSLRDDDLLDLIRVCRRSRVKVTIVPRLFEVIGRGVEVDEVEGMTVLGLRGVSRSRSSILLKRAIDICGSGLGLLILSPLLVVIAIAIKATSRGPVFYGSERMGARGRPFTMWKFRSMIDGADGLKPLLLHLNEADGVMFKIADDPRITRLGRLLRRTSLDELPQLWNVLRGEMSLVGPRPLVVDEDDHVIGWHRSRLELTPGLTGPWQVMGRTSIPFDEMVKMDYLYVAEWSLWRDVCLMLRTLPVVVFGRGA